MSTSFLHIATSFIPVYFGGAAIFLHNIGRISRKPKLKNLSYKLFMLTGAFTTITCGFGGASIRAAESIPGIDIATIRIHAWTAMLVFLLSVILVIFSYKANREMGTNKKADSYVLLFSFCFIFVFIATTLIAFKIR